MKGRPGGLRRQEVVSPIANTGYVQPRPNRELADIGFSRLNLRDVAREAIYGN